MVTEKKINSIVSPIELSTSFATEQILESIANNKYMAIGFNHFDNSFTAKDPENRFGFIDKKMSQELYGTPIVFNIFR